jgi:hypothetical protein
MDARPSTHRHARQAEAGFTLVEALAAIVILAFGLIAVTNLLLLAGSSNSVANQSTAATVAAMEQLEMFKSLTWGDAALPNPGAGVKLGDVDAEPPDPCCLRNVVIAQTGAGEVQRVPVQVRWEFVGIDNWTIYIRVRAQSTGPLGRRTRAEFTTMRVCSTCI